MTDRFLKAQFVDVERRTVTVHQDHRRGEVETASRQDPDRSLRVERFAGHHSGRVEVVAASRQD